MPLTFSADQRTRRVYARTRGVLTPTDIAQYLSDRATADVVDFDQVIVLDHTESLVRHEDLGVFVRDRRAALGGRAGGRIALVAASDTRYAEASRASLELATLGPTVYAARTVADAEQWLAGCA